MAPHRPSAQSVADTLLELESELSSPPPQPPATAAAASGTASRAIVFRILLERRDIALLLLAAGTGARRLALGGPAPGRWGGRERPQHVGAILDDSVARLGHHVPD